MVSTKGKVQKGKGGKTREGVYKETVRRRRRICVKKGRIGKEKFNNERVRRQGRSCKRRG